MSTSAVNTLLGNTSTSGSASAAASSSSASLGLKPSDFIKMMITQLQHQDPTQPTSNQELLSQMSQIGQLQSSTDLQATMKSVTLQTQVGSASSLIGKKVAGIDSSGNPLSGVVNSVAVAGGTVSLKLDSGTSLDLSQLSTISPATATTGS